MILTPSLPGVTVVPLTTHLDDRGWLTELLRSDDPHYAGFGQVYACALHPGAIKAWHRHQWQEDAQACLVGAVKLVCAERDIVEGEWYVQEVYLSPLTPRLVVIARGTWHGVQNVGEGTAMMLNIPTCVYDRERPDEERLEAHGGIPGYDWARRDR